MEILKYPRTRHLEGSRLQAGDSADDEPLAALRGVSLTIEEKLDGANAALSFDASGGLWLQSRGHFLAGGGRERQFALFKTWAYTHAQALHAVLGARYVMYGEWLYAKHTVFYDRLPHFFLEFDVWDREAGAFLSTAARRALLGGLPVMPVPVLGQGTVGRVSDLQRQVAVSLYKSAGWRAALAEAAQASGSRLDMVMRQTDDSDLAEGLYLKREAGSAVAARYKFVRAGFLQAIKDADSHWHDRPILPNRLAPGVDILAPVLGVPGAYDGPPADRIADRGAGR
ncbi:MAG: RNA ligase family protein [Pseudomonadota bacterium]